MKPCLHLLSKKQAGHCYTSWAAFWDHYSKSKGLSVQASYFSTSCPSPIKIVKIATQYLRCHSENAQPFQVKAAQSSSLSVSPASPSWQACLRTGRGELGGVAAAGASDCVTRFAVRVHVSLPANSIPGRGTRIPRTGARQPAHHDDRTPLARE